MSLFADVLSSLDASQMGDIAGALGESSSSVSQGMQSAMGTVMAGLADKSGHPGMLQKMLDLAPTWLGHATSSDLASAITNPSSLLMSTGKRMLSGLFGESQGQLAEALGTGTGLTAGTTSSLLAMAAPMVMSFLGKYVKDEGLSVAGLGNMLQREAPAIRAILPARVAALLGPSEHEVVPASPMAAGAAPQRSSWGWLLPVLILCLIPLLWLVRHGRKPIIETPPVQTGTANRSIPEAALPTSLDLHFQPGSMKLQPAAETQLRRFALAQAANRDAYIAVNGYTDSTGGDSKNLRISQERADAVRAYLIGMGVPADRVTARGFGEQNPIADNSTTLGREANNRVTVETSAR